MNKYLVIYKDNDGELLEPVIQTACQIFDMMDMSDCHGITIERIFLLDGSKVVECRFWGTWHDPKEPLKMVIEPMISATSEQMEPYDVGYGTDH